MRRKCDIIPCEIYERGDTVTLKEVARAKINLYLDVVGRRPDGYHDLVSVMQSISLADTLTLERLGEEIVLCTAADLPCDEHNLAFRAAKAFFAALGQAFGVRITLEKRIPIQAGLGGGSADAAAVLRGLNRLAGAPFDTERLCEIAAGIGADVPFCVVGGTRLCRGVGERMEPVKNIRDPFVVVAMAGEGVSTPWAFAELDERFGDFAACATASVEQVPKLLQALAGADGQLSEELLFNRFEGVIEPQRPMISHIKSTMSDCGAYCARMSGSGPAVFGLFENELAACNAQKALCTMGARAFVCRFENEKAGE